MKTLILFVYYSNLIYQISGDVSETNSKKIENNDNIKIKETVASTVF